MQPPRLTSPETDVLTDSGDSLLAGSESPAATTDKKSAPARTAPQGFPPENTDPAQVRVANRTQAATQAANVTFTVYRFYDEGGQLLYVGQTIRVEHRLSQHRKAKGWWDSIARIELEHYPTRRAALAAESAQIAELNPLYNVVLTRPVAPRPRWRRLRAHFIQGDIECYMSAADLGEQLRWTRRDIEAAIAQGCPHVYLPGGTWRQIRFQPSRVEDWLQKHYAEIIDLPLGLA